ncbi:MAG: CocE/NonD family hydrolase C-terminal non-catalytic domain-containing protein [Gemmatimonadales bacterium]
MPKRLYLLPGGHGVVLGQKVFQQDQVRWFDRWLKGANSGVDREQPVTVFWEMSRQGGTALGGGESKPNWITTYDAWPPAEARSQAFYLTGDARLSSVKPSGVEETAPRSYTYPTGTELIGSNAQFSLPVEPEGVLVYRSPPMTEDLTILGAPQLTFFVSLDHEDADFAVDLHDLYPNGDVQCLQHDLLRASMRAIDLTEAADAIRHRFDPLGAPGARPSVRDPDVAATGRRGDPAGSPARGDDHGPVTDRPAGLGLSAHRPAGPEHRLPLGGPALGAHGARDSWCPGAGPGSGVRQPGLSALPGGEHRRPTHVHRETEDRALGGGGPAIEGGRARRQVE